MTGSQDYLTGPGSQDYLTAPGSTATAPPVPPPQQHSPASTSSSGSAGYTNAQTRPPVINYMGTMGWESPGGTTHFTTPPFQFEHCYPMVITPPNPHQDGGTPAGVAVPPPPIPPQCMNGDGGRGGGGGGGGGGPPPAAPQAFHFHVKPGDPMQMQQGGQGMVHLVCNMHEHHPIQLGIQGHPGTYMLNENGVFILPDPSNLYPPGPPPYSNGTTPPWNNQYYMSPPPPQSANYGPPQQQPPHPQYYSPTTTPMQQDPTTINTATTPPSTTSRPPKPASHKRKHRDTLKSGVGGGVSNGGGSKSTGSTSPSLSVQSTPPQSPVKPRSLGVGGTNGVGVGSNGGMMMGGGGGMMMNMGGGGGGYSRHRGNVVGLPPMMIVGSGHIGEDSEESGIGNEPDEDQEEKELYIELLSNIRTPIVSDVRDSMAKLEWRPPVSEPGDVRFDSIKPMQPNDLDYEVKLSDKGKEGKYRSIYTGDSLSCLLKDLRPNTEYHVRVQANLKSRHLKGGTSDTVSFRTKCTVPDQPQPPKLTQKSRTSLHLRWNATADNGKHILHYTLECDDGSGDVNRFKIVYEGRAKQCNVSRLQPSTIYKFRLAAVNELGSSPYSEVMNYATQGSPPSQPQPPKFTEVTESSIHLLWSKRPCDDEFTLQMEDPKTGHGFLSRYNGTDTEHTVEDLRKNTTYRFKLRAHNEMGGSAYSQDVSCTTRPGRPGPPHKPQVKGKIRATSFKAIWNPPDDNGGSPVTGYELEMDGGGGWQSVYRGDATEFLFDDLQPGTTYRVRVASVSAGGMGDFSESCFVVTEPVVPGPPSSPALVDKPKNKLPGTALHLTWGPPEYDGGAMVTEYEIDMTAPDNSTKGVYRGRETECVVASLLPGRPYLFQVRAYNRAGCGPWSHPLETISGAGPPDKPREPKATVKSGTCVNLAWDQPINNGAIITRYLLQMACVCSAPLLDESDSESQSEVEEDESEVEEDDEDSDSDDSEYDDEDSDDQLVANKEKAKSEQIYKGAVSKSGHCDTQVSERVSVSPPRELVSPPRELEWRQVYSGQDRAVDVADLVPASQYQFKVCAMNSAGISPYSCCVSVDTPATPPAAPHTLVAHAPSTSSCIAFKWKRPAVNGDPITSYRIEWSEKSSNSNNVSELVVDAPRRRARLENLKPDTAYTVRVQAVNTRGRGPLSAPLKVATKPLPPAPPRLECLNVSHNTLKLKWGGGGVQGSTTYCLETENQKKVWYPVYQGSAQSYKHNKLTENQEYRYRICASSEAGQGPFSSPVTFRTSYAPPPGLKAPPRVTAITETGCLIQWSAVKAPNLTEPLHYKVVVSRGKECVPGVDQPGNIQHQCATTQLRLSSSLASRAEYTVRVVTVRHLRDHSRLEGPVSPPYTFTTLGQQVTDSRVSSSACSSGRGGHHHQSGDGEHRGGRHSAGGSSHSAEWSDKKYAAVILSGFTLFAVFVAMIIQQLISLGAISS